MNLLRAVALAASLVLVGGSQAMHANTQPAAEAACNFQCSASITVPAVSPDFGPIALPAGAKVRGMSLSGSASLSQTGTAGATTWRERKIEWAERYELERGCALVSTAQGVLLTAEPATAFIAKGTSAIVHREKDATRFANLTDRHQGGMTVVFGNHYIELDPGFELVLVKAGNRDAKTVAIQEGIGWRDLKQMESDGYSVFAFRVYAPDLLTKCHIYRELNQSPLEADHRIRDELVRTVAALDAMYNRKRGPFRIDDPYQYGNGEKPQTAEAANGV